MTTSDLVIRARTGNREAFDMLARRFWHRCCRVAWIYMRNHHDAEDEAQNALLEAYLHIGQCDASKFESWLDKIVQNKCLMRHRERRMRPGRFFYLHNRPHARIRSYEPDPEKQVAEASLAKVMQMEVARLPKLFREVIELRRLREMEIGDVARILEINVHAAKSRLVRGTHALRSRLEECGIG
jgi:RNA polymerase sigma-70 factor (ECF subfamily)